MESTDLILNLPVELACEVLGKWLELRYLPRVDSAFCQVLKRKKLLESIFQSPLLRCKVFYRTGEEVKLPIHPEEGIKWILAKNIRAEFVTFNGESDVPSGLEYLQQFGSWVEGVCFEVSVSDEYTYQVLRMCPNIGAFMHADCHVTETFVTLLSECTKLSYLVLSSEDDAVASEGDSGEEGHAAKDFDRVPLVPSLHVDTLLIGCEECAQAAILRICEPRSVQALFVTYCGSVLDWSCYTNLRSLGVHTRAHERASLLPIFAQCPWITDLDLSQVDGLLDEDFTEIVRSLRQIRTLNIQDAEHLTDVALQRLVEMHGHCLDSIFLGTLPQFTANGINDLLKRCTRLHTISCLHTTGLDHALMRNITTLDTDFPCHNDYPTVWRAIQQNCYCLQHLYLSYPQQAEGITANIHLMVETMNTVQSLRCVHLAGFYACSRDHLRNASVSLRPGVNVVEERFSPWSKFFDMPFGIA